MLSFQSVQRERANLLLPLPEPSGKRSGSKSSICDCIWTRARLTIDSKLWFFENHVLAEKETLAWLHKCISVARFTYLMKNMAFQKPSIWLLTGVYTLEDATFGTLKIKEGHINAAVSAPIISQALMGLDPGISVNVSKDCSVKCDGKIPESSVWAGQWVRLKIDFLPRNRAIDPNEISLRELQDLGGPLRAPDDSANLGCVVQLSLDEDLDQNDFPDIIPAENVDKDINDQSFWDAYEKAWAQWAQ
jgi:hypothetical protein